MHLCIILSICVIGHKQLCETIHQKQKSYNVPCSLYYWEPSPLPPFHFIFCPQAPIARGQWTATSSSCVARKASDWCNNSAPTKSQKQSAYKLRSNPFAFFAYANCLLLLSRDYCRLRCWCQGGSRCSTLALSLSCSPPKCGRILYAR